VGGALTAPVAGAATGKVGAQPTGLGLGSKAALAQSTCNATTKHTKFAVDSGDPQSGGPFCVNPWPAGSKNGGATAPGVTATTVKVVVYYPNAAMTAAEKAAGGAPPINQATGQDGTWPDAIKDFDTVYQYANQHYGTFQTWGRKPVYSFVQATGSDEASQRADALTVEQMKPFIVIDASNQNAGGTFFESEMAKAHIIVNGAAASQLTTAEVQAQSPYRWATQSDSTAGLYLLANFLGNQVSGQKAQWAGDSSLQGKPRAFGVIYPQGNVDINLVNSLFKKYGVTKPVSEQAYDPTNTSNQQDAAKTATAQFQSAGVTSIILLSNNTETAALTNAAASNNYKPEWIVTGYQFQDFDGFGRSYNQDEFAHAFGLGVLPPETPQSSSVGPFQWYWGTKQGTSNPTTNGWMRFIYNAIQYAGPKLTVANVQKGLFSVPAQGGASDGTTQFQTGYGKTVGLPYNEYFGLGTDVEQAWWNPNIFGGANAVPAITGQGKFEYLNNGKRFSFGQFAKGTTPKFFDTSASVSQVPLSAVYIGGIVPTATSCSDCPSASSS
jgi:hypothetical protein